MNIGFAGTKLRCRVCGGEGSGDGPFTEGVREEDVGDGYIETVCPYCRHDGQPDRIVRPIDMNGNSM